VFIILPLKEYENEVLIRMLDKEIINYRYLPTETISHQINWNEIQASFNIKKKFKSIMEKLKNKGYVTDHGKSGEVYSLTFIGLAYAKNKSSNRK
jgi:hypothetical protein